MTPSLPEQSDRAAAATLALPVIDLYFLRHDA